jgi:cell division transport system permease protein
MTLAVIVTMWVSLSLFGLGLLAAQQVELIKGKWYDKIEITVFLCVPASQASTCDAGVGTTDAQRAQIQQTLKSNPEVSEVYYESKAEAWADFQQVYANEPILSAMTEDMMQDSFRVKLADPQQYQGVVAAMTGVKGVESVQDLHTVLDPLFAWLNMAQWGTIGASVLLLVAAALQIGNTIRLTAFSRRREIGIMRLVGASNWYIMLPFLLESLVAAIIGAALAALSLTALVRFVIIGKAENEITSIAWLGWPQLQWTVGFIALVAIVLSIIPTLIATRRFLRV